MYSGAIPVLLKLELYSESRVDLSTLCTSLVCSFVLPLCSVSLPIKGINPSWFHLTRAAWAPLSQRVLCKGILNFAPPPHWKNKYRHQHSSVWPRLPHWETGSTFCPLSPRQSQESIHLTEDVPKPQRASISHRCGLAVRKMTLKGKGRFSWYCHNKRKIWGKARRLSVGQESQEATL